MIKVIIDGVKGLVLCPSTALNMLNRSFLEHCTLTNKDVGIIWRPCPNLLRGDKAVIIVPLIFSREYLCPWKSTLLSVWVEHNLLWRMSLEMFNIFFNQLLCLWTDSDDLSALGWLLILSLQKEYITYNLLMCVLLITQLLPLLGRIASCKPVQPHQLGGCRCSNIKRDFY